MEVAFFIAFKFFLNRSESNIREKGPQGICDRLAKMKIFLSLKVPRGDTERETIITHLRDAISTVGHTPFIAIQEIARAGLTAPQDFMPFVREHLADTDLLIVVYHPELRGGLIEVGMAYERRIPIWLCHKPNEKVSSSMLGCANMVIQYDNSVDLQGKINLLMSTA